MRIAALDRRGLVRRTGWSPRDDAVRAPENLLRHVRIEIRAGGGAPVALAHHPPGRSIRGGERLGHLREDRGFQLHPADSFRLQHGEEPAVDQRFDDGSGQLPDFVVFRRGRGDYGQEIARLLHLRMDARHAVSPALRQRGPDGLVGRITKRRGVRVKRRPCPDRDVHPVRRQCAQNLKTRARRRWRVERTAAHATRIARRPQPQPSRTKHRGGIRVWHSNLYRYLC